MVDRLCVRRFNVAEYHEMKRLGILPPQARVELLDGMVTDMHRPTQRELEVIAQVAEVLAEKLGDRTTIHAGPPAHPEAYATFDPTLMVHDWAVFPLTAPLPLHRFSIAEYRRLIEVGIVPSKQTELIDGVVFEMALRSDRVRGIAAHLQSLLPAPRSAHAMWWLGKPVRLGPYSEVWSDLALVQPREDGYAQGLPTGADVSLLIDIRDAGSDERQAVEWPVYARWGVKAAWLIDVHERRILAGRDPMGDAYTVVMICEEPDTIDIPVDGIQPDVLVSAARVFTAATYPEARRAPE
jgi:Uma2 family endonuclease